MNIMFHWLSFTRCPPGMRRDRLDPTTCGKVDECQERSPCVHGRCVDRQYGYSCRCEAGYRGRKCDKPRRKGRKGRGRRRNKGKMK